MLKYGTGIKIILIGISHATKRSELYSFWAVKAENLFIFLANNFRITHSIPISGTEFTTSCITSWIPNDGLLSVSDKVS